VDYRVYAEPDSVGTAQDFDPRRLLTVQKSAQGIHAAKVVWAGRLSIERQLSLFDRLSMAIDFGAWMSTGSPNQSDKVRGLPGLNP
jgi:hypothetical protein